MPRVTSDATSSAKAPAVSTIAAPERGLGEAERSSGASLALVCAVTNEPVTPPVAKAGWRAGAKAMTRRPLASRTAWPRWAANPSATAMVPSTNRRDDAWAISLARQATAAPPGGGPAGRIAMVDLRIVNARPQLPQVSIAGGADEAALGAGEDELIAGLGPAWRRPRRSWPRSRSRARPAGNTGLPSSSRGAGRRGIDVGDPQPRLAHEVDEPEQDDQADAAARRRR